MKQFEKVKAAKENSPPIKGIIFDLDGTLYKMHWIIRPWMTIKAFPNIFRLPRFLKERSRYAGLDLNCKNDLMNKLCSSLSVIEKCQPEEIQKWIDTVFYPSFVSSMIFFKNSRPGVNATLEKLKDSGIKLGVLSDYDLVAERLQKLGIDTSLFETLTSSEFYGALKPSPRPLLAVAELWNLKPENVLIVGDRDDTDGAAAKAAGMQFQKICDKGEDLNSWSALQQYFSNLCR
ncbi:HAD family hydrolase [Chitinispirillales bacterium ANBcel5]|uniref:HAD family hydrolase n=1 Tax=Cellulosispirillum alkaliphilum TaxID=3039283 RepID=UPI002A4FA00E|nr:HAD family hydrolase [Chitinispirillales bacterium ANBcel5]